MQFGNHVSDPKHILKALGESTMWSGESGEYCKMGYSAAFLKGWGDTRFFFKLVQIHGITARDILCYLMVKESTQTVDSKFKLTSVL